MIFTPFGGSIETDNLDDMGRFHMELDAPDMNQIKRGVQWKAEVTDQNTGKMYLVKGVSCGTPHCYCAAKIVKRLEK